MTAYSQIKKVNPVGNKVASPAAMLFISRMTKNLSNMSARWVFVWLT
jgi:hypothetical protein